jgi:hypothetical protein
VSASPITKHLPSPSLDEKIQALLTQNRLLNEKLRGKLSTDTTVIKNLSQEMDLSWSTPKLVDDFSVEAGSIITGQHDHFMR